MANFREHFGDPIQEITVTRQIKELLQGNRRVRQYIEKLKLITTGLDGNEIALMAQFWKDLNDQIAHELTR